MQRQCTRVELYNECATWRLHQSYSPFAISILAVVLSDRSQGSATEARIHLGALV